MKQRWLGEVVLGILMLAASPGAYGGEIHEAARDGDIEVVKRLLSSNPALVHQRDRVDATPLNWAAPEAHRDIVELLLRYGADVNARAVSGATPLHSAVHRGQTDIVELLLAHKADVNIRTKEDGLTPLHTAAFRNYPEIVKMLLLNGADINATNPHGHTPLHNAAAAGHRGVVQILLAGGARVDPRDVLLLKVLGVWTPPR